MQNEAPGLAGRPDFARIDAVVAAGRDALLAAQRPDGHWVFELEADATIPAEYVLLLHYFGRSNPALEAKIAVYLRRIQGAHGGWPLFHDGAFDMSASVKAYFALKMIGEDVNSPLMVKAREAILSRGGAAQSNVFTRFLLALYGEVPWRATPAMPIEIMLLPRWFPFHLDKISYWARTVLVPLLVLQSLKPQARNPKGVGIRELFTTPPEAVRHWPRGAHQTSPWASVFGAIDRVLQRIQHRFPAGPRRRSIERAVAFVDERLNGEDGLGAIYPAMANAVMMYDVLGVPEDDPRVIQAWRAIERLVIETDEEAYCQPCLSPVWDTALVSHALLEAENGKVTKPVEAALQWLAPLQVLDVKGDWAARRPDVRPGGWAFQYANPHYPDLDDTAVVVMAMDRAHKGGGQAFDPAIARGREWIEGLQSRNGGFGAFDADNNFHYLNHIPFADHGALLDPPTADVTARCISMLAQLGETTETSETLRRAVQNLLDEQEKDGSWFGRWGMNYIYGSWSALCALNLVRNAETEPAIRRCADWLIGIQNPDGGWGEGGDSYKLAYRGYEPAPSTASQTAWALLGLMAAGLHQHEAVARGIAYLTREQGADGFWQEPFHTATGFPRIFYLRYHGYSKFFPLWAVARYRNLVASNSGVVTAGM
ncbi:MAG: squalene--hopene cyclase [Methylobacterium sp.]|nr:MAG: squalene--hopene cyclase [Methylobacterium sp.]